MSGASPIKRTLTAWHSRVCYIINERRVLGVQLRLRLLLYTVTGVVLRMQKCWCIWQTAWIPEGSVPLAAGGRTPFTDACGCVICGHQMFQGEHLAFWVQITRGESWISERANETWEEGFFWALHAYYTKIISSFFSSWMFSTIWCSHFLLPSSKIKVIRTQKYPFFCLFCRQTFNLSMNKWGTNDAPVTAHTHTQGHVYYCKGKSEFFSCAVAPSS